jgi:hypothetical protein
MLDKLEKLGTEGGTPTRKVAVCDSGVFDPVEEELKVREECTTDVCYDGVLEDASVWLLSAAACGC